jgi:hypothetical protein
VTTKTKIEVRKLGKPLFTVEVPALDPDDALELELRINASNTLRCWISDATPEPEPENP